MHVKARTLQVCTHNAEGQSEEIAGQSEDVAGMHPNTEGQRVQFAPIHLQFAPSGKVGTLSEPNLWHVEACGKGLYYHS
ncbi:MAG: hypothetical protein IPL35_14425 [Sphingobacteriales bacterium]|nr:hypothetical protein [Sphingobacteriales bacterium]